MNLIKTFISVELSVVAIVATAVVAAPAAEEKSAPAADWPWAAYGIPKSSNPACIPTRRTDWADASHRVMLLKEKRHDLELVFLGDSITMMWRSQSGFEGGTPVWEKYYAPLKAGNFGISGDGTQNVLWRITEGGALDGLRPKVLVLLIGINNLEGVREGKTPEQVAEGIATLVKYIKGKLPETRILLLGLFPCWESPQNPSRERVRQVNLLIRPLEDRKHVYYLDIGQKFLEPDGTIKKEKLRDFLHLSEKGYAIWAQAMEPYLKDLMNNDGNGDIWNKRGEQGETQ